MAALAESPDRPGPALSDAGSRPLEWIDPSPWVRGGSLLILALCVVNLVALYLGSTGAAGDSLVAGYFVAIAAYLLSCFAIGVFHRSPDDSGLRPRVSVIVTTGDEESPVYHTIERCYAADYPRDKLEIIVVDGGATGDTLYEIERAARRWPDLVVRRPSAPQPMHRALSAAARVATSDVLVHVCSGTFLRRTSIREIVQGFGDPEVAAVIGRVETANAEQGFLTRLQAVGNEIAFRTFVAAASVFGVVSRSSGFAAYHRSSLLPALGAWESLSTTDVATLPAAVLREHHVIYTANAVADVAVPEDHDGLSKTVLHALRAWIEASGMAARFLWRKHPVAAILFYTALFLTVAAPVVALYGLVWLPVTEGVLTAAMTIVFGLVLTGCIVAGCALFWNATGDWVYAAYFTLYFAIIAAFEFPYALVSRR